MNLDFNTANVTAFRNYLIKNDYSKHLIPMYVRKVDAFLKVSSESTPKTLVRAIRS